MSWFQTRDGHVVYAEGGLADVYRARGAVESDERPDDTPDDDVESGDSGWEPVLEVEHRTHADLTEQELADARQVTDDESPSGVRDAD